jgi:hypothetical protein
MNRSFIAVPAMMCLVAVVITAQAPAEKPTQQQPAEQQQPARPAEPSATAASKTTYTGCLKPGTAAGTWILESAEVAAKPGASAPSTVGTSGAAKMTFNLNPAATVNLTPHANHKVEVVGSLSAAKPGADAAPSSAAGAQAPRQQFSVESLKMVAATCP